MAAAAGGSVRQAAGRATATPPTLITSLPGLIKLFQVRDRLLVTALSYLLATIAAVSCLGAVSRSALRPLKAGPVALGVGSLSD